MLQSGGEGPVNWQLAHDTARQAVAARGDASVLRTEREAVDEAVRLAEVWLDPVTALPAGTSRPWPGAEPSGWRARCRCGRGLIEPLAARMAEASTSALPAEAQAMAGPMLGMFQQLGGAHGGRAGGAGASASWPARWSAAPTSACRSAPRARRRSSRVNIRGVHAEGLGVPEDEVRLHLALRECAHAAAVRARAVAAGRALLDAVGATPRASPSTPTPCASGWARSTPTTPPRSSRPWSRGCSSPPTPPRSRRPSTGWRRCSPWSRAGSTSWSRPRPTPPPATPSPWARPYVADGRQAAPPRRRSRALVGLQLRPRRMREAAEVWRQLTEALGSDGRDAVWENPLGLPGPADLAEPAAYVARRASVDDEVAGLEIPRRPVRPRRSVIDPPPTAAHQDALAALSSWVAPDEAQGALRERYCAVLRARPDAVDRSGRPEHLTASALVLSSDGDRVLLGLHRKVGRWLQMGGHLEAADRSLSGAALREAREESGVEGLVLLAGGPVRLDAHPVRCAGPAEPERIHLDVQYAAIAPSGAVERLSRGVDRLGVVPRRRAACGQRRLGAAAGVRRAASARRGRLEQPVPTVVEVVCLWLRGGAEAPRMAGPRPARSRRGSHGRARCPESAPRGPRRRGRDWPPAGARARARGRSRGRSPAWPAGARRPGSSGRRACTSPTAAPGWSPTAPRPAPRPGRPRRGGCAPAAGPAPAAGRRWGPCGWPWPRAAPPWSRPSGPPRPRLIRAGMSTTTRSPER